MENPLTQEINAELLPSLCDLLAARDPELRKLVEHYGYPPMWSRPAGFATLVQIILEQQVSLSSAAACFKRLLQLSPQIIPESLGLLADEELRHAAVSRQKIAYLRALSSAVKNGELDLEGLQRLDDEAVIQHLTSVKGIGRWTADVYLMMALHRCDRFPMGDVALLQSMREQLYDNAKIPVEDLAERAMHWAPYRTVAAFLLWHAYLAKRGRSFTTIVP